MASPTEGGRATPCVSARGSSPNSSTSPAPQASTERARRTPTVSFSGAVSVMSVGNTPGRLCHLCESFLANFGMLPFKLQQRVTRPRVDARKLLEFKELTGPLWIRRSMVMALLIPDRR